MKDTTAVLLCGGKGERLKPFSDTLPKALVPLLGKPLLRYLLDYLYDEGIRRFVVCVGHKGGVLREFIEQQRDRDWELICVDSGDAPMTDRIIDALGHISGRALICYGDTLANVNLSGLKEFHDARRAPATVTVYPLHSPFGLVYFGDDSEVTALVEKPLLPYYINIGFVLCEKDALAGMRRGCDMVMFLNDAIGLGGLNAFIHAGRHLTVNTDKERKEAEQHLVEFFSA